MRVVAAIALACLAHCADTTPRSQSSGTKGGKKFTLRQVQNDDFRGRDAPSAFLKAHLKYGQTLPPQLRRVLNDNPGLKAKFLAQAQAPYKSLQAFKYSRLARNADLAETEHKRARSRRLLRSNMTEYAIQVQIGTPPQTIPLNLDTGSADLWTFSSDTYKGLVLNQTLYYADNSSTSKLLRGEGWQVGDTYVDNQGVQAAISVSPEISKDSFTSGILGMANSRVNTAKPTQQRTYIDNIKDSLEKPFFTANLRNRRPGNYNFGYIDDAEHVGKIQYAAVNPYSPFWEVTVNGFDVGYDDFPNPMSFNAIVDTGTSLLLLPDSIVEEYYSHVPGAGIDPRLGVVTFPCDVRPPDFHFYIGPHRARIPGAYINYGRVGPKYCHGGIQTARGIPFAVLGDVALKAQFVVFNYEQGLVGFANKKLDE